ncbi:MAG: shikimate kinase [Bacteroidales bacterium]|nr:shikimate kinase [Bacteroidales bacterium]
MNVFLIGYMGSGKTTVGKKLSRSMSYDFVDLDVQIEQSIGMSINDYFQKKGEESFRELEHKELHKCFKLENTVISLGGGTPCYFDNLEQINQHGISVYIKMSAVSLSSRLQNAKSPRPLVKGLSDGELFEFVQHQLGERERFYNKSHLLIKGESLKIPELLNLINSKLLE